MRQAGDLCGGTKEAEAAASAREAHAAHEAVRAEAAKAAARAEAGGAIETVAAHAEAARAEAGEAAEVQGQLDATSMVGRPVEVKRVLVDFRVNLAVSADDYGEAVLAGANFDEVNGVFFMPPRVDLLPVSEWLPFNLDGRTNSSRHRPSILPEPPVLESVFIATQMRVITASPLEGDFMALVVVATLLVLAHMVLVEAHRYFILRHAVLMPKRRRRHAFNVHVNRHVVVMILFGFIWGCVFRTYS